MKKEGKIGKSFIPTLLEDYLAGSFESFKEYWVTKEEHLIERNEWEPLIEELVNSIVEETNGKTIQQKVGWVINQFNYQNSFKIYNNKEVAEKVKGLLLKE